MESAGASTHRWITAAAVLAAALALTLQLFVEPVVGLANNGDFERVMEYAGLAYQTDRYQERYWGHIVTKFDVVEPRWTPGGHLSSEIPIVCAARGLGRVSTPDGPFDIRILGALHAILLLTAIGLGVSACRDLAPPVQGLAALLLVFVFTDVGYAAPLNSLYSQVASLVFLLLTLSIAALAIRRGRLEGRLLAAYFLCAVLFVGSKPQEAIQGPILAVLALLLAGVGGRSCWRRAATWLALGLCAFSLWYFASMPRRGILHVGLFHTVFADLLPSSPDPAGDLDWLGLDRSLIAYSGMHAYGPDAPLALPTFQARFFDRFGYGALLRFYAAHPARLYDRLDRGASDAFRLRPTRLGNFEKPARPAWLAMSDRFFWWSTVRLGLNRRGLLWITLLFAGNLAAIAAGYRRSRGRARLFRECLALVVLMAGVEFGVCVFADDLEDVARHLFVFQSLFDLVLIVDAVWLARSLSSSRPAPRETAPEAA